MSESEIDGLAERRIREKEVEDIMTWDGSASPGRDGGVDGGSKTVECPACGHEFPVEKQ